jgi:putative spermidine/putrescine transport system substrate-binding protein
MRAVRSLDRFSPTRRQALLGSAAAILTAGAGREAHAAAGTVVVSNWGGDWNQRTVRFVEAPLVETKGLTVVRDLGMEPERKAKLLAERRLIGPHEVVQGQS